MSYKIRVIKNPLSLLFLYHHICIIVQPRSGALLPYWPSLKLLCTLSLVKDCAVSNPYPMLYKFSVTEDAKFKFPAAVCIQPSADVYAV